MALEIMEFSIQDYPEVIGLWRESEGIGLSAADSPERIGAYLERNPGTSFVARENGELVGAVLAGHDGRRGYLHHLAVRAGRRGNGIGRLLAERCLAALKAAGIDKCHLFVYQANDPGKSFWRKNGWVERVELVVMSKDIKDG